MRRSSRIDTEMGATAVEYGLMVGFIAVVIVGAVTLFGSQVLALFTSMPPHL